jgi:hypothetical protein
VELGDHLEDLTVDIRLTLKEDFTGCEGEDWICVAHDRVKCGIL